MNRTAGESVDLAEGVVKETGDQTLVDVVLCPPFTSLQSVASAIED